MIRVGAGLLGAFGVLVALLTLRPVGQAVMLHLRRRECPAAFDAATVAAAVALVIGS